MFPRKVGVQVCSLIVAGERERDVLRTPNNGHCDSGLSTGSVAPPGPSLALKYEFSIEDSLADCRDCRDCKVRAIDITMSVPKSVPVLWAHARGHRR